MPDSYTRGLSEGLSDGASTPAGGSLEAEGLSDGGRDVVGDYHVGDGRGRPHTFAPYNKR